MTIGYAPSLLGLNTLVGGSFEPLRTEKTMNDPEVKKQK
jgi:hypothetical protein